MNNQSVNFDLSYYFDGEDNPDSLYVGVDYADGKGINISKTVTGTIDNAESVINDLLSELLTDYYQQSAKLKTAAENDFEEEDNFEKEDYIAVLEQGISKLQNENKELKSDIAQLKKMQENFKNLLKKRFIW